MTTKERQTEPALVIHGERDRFAPLGAARFLAGHLPQARLEIVRAAGHAPFLSHPELFLEQLRGFIHDRNYCGGATVTD